ncbi:hypothetical protein M0802_012586 [Mischocyttarus mexicanus]|nr:hypothetical protein M0802_012586 [Mischocyttarus mexicanus]
MSIVRPKTIKNYKDFHIFADVNASIKITHKKIVKYLGIHLDEKFLLNEHLLLQLQKAEAAYITCKIWFNVSAGMMESLRIFERRCVRACLGLYKSAESNYTNKGWDKAQTFWKLYTLVDVD